MIAAAIFSVAGIIAWQNTSGESTNSEGEVEETFFFVLLALICWVIAGLCAGGVIKTY